MLKFSKLTALVLTVFFVTRAAHAAEKETRTSFVLVTSKGSMVCELFDSKAPKACENFITLSKKNYYDNTHFHRVIPGFMCQAGDPTGTGKGGKSIWGVTFKDEFHESLTFSKKGLLAMANRGPNTNTSQFFITTAKTPWLNKKHTIFGRVVQGFDTLEAIEKCGTKAGNLKEKVFIKSIIFDSPATETQKLTSKELSKPKQS